MPIESDGVDDTDSNDGPHCRNCHTGASQCNVCHTVGKGGYTATITAPVIDKTSYAAQTYYKASAAVAVNGQCLDGGFSFPHRTLGANMLKDELYGIDFAGNPVAANEVRTTNGVGTVISAWSVEDANAGSIIAAVSSDTTPLVGTAAENLDSVCIDCHGDATYYNGDNRSFFTTSYDGSLTNTPGVYGYAKSVGWELLLKGLP